MFPRIGSGAEVEGAVTEKLSVPGVAGDRVAVIVPVPTPIGVTTPELFTVAAPVLLLLKVALFDTQDAVDESLYVTVQVGVTVEPGYDKLIGLGALKAIETAVGVAVTVKASVPGVAGDNIAVIVPDPPPTGVTTPLELTVAAPVLLELNVAPPATQDPVEESL